MAGGGGPSRAIMPPAPFLPPRNVGGGGGPPLPSRNTGASKPGSYQVTAIQDFLTGEDGDLELRYGEVITDVEEGRN